MLGYRNLNDENEFVALQSIYMGSTMINFNPLINYNPNYGTPNYLRFKKS